MTRHAVVVGNSPAVAEAGTIASRRSDRVTVTVILMATVLVQIWVGITTARWTIPVLIPAAAVAVCGLALPLAGGWAAAVVKKKDDRATNGGVLLGAVTLAAVGLVWVAGGVALLLAAEGVILLCCAIAALSASPPTARRRLRMLAAPLPAMVATALLWVIPSAPVLRFMLEDESGANHLVSEVTPYLHGPCIFRANLPALSGYGTPASVCGQPDRLVIRMNRSRDALALAASTATFEDECVKHLDRHWWALADPNPNCPTGYRFVPGG